MHTFISGDVCFNHHGDFSGDVVINRQGKEIQIPFEDLKALVAEWIRMERIAALEEANADELVKP